MLNTKIERTCCNNKAKVKKKKKFSYRSLFIQTFFLRAHSGSDLFLISSLKKKGKFTTIYHRVLCRCLYKGLRILMSQQPGPFVSFNIVNSKSSFNGFLAKRQSQCHEKNPKKTKPRKHLSLVQRWCRNFVLLTLLFLPHHPPNTFSSPPHVHFTLP